MLQLLQEMEEAAMGTNEIDNLAERPLSCDQCPSVFTSLTDLEQHLETHKEERPFKCRQCEKSYRHAGSLVNHRKTHEVGLFTCLVCQKDLSNPMALKNHLRTHSEEKRFQCTDCGEGFRLSRQLSNHRLTVHSEMSCKYTMSNDDGFGDDHMSLNSSLPLLRENHNLLSNLENYIAESMVPADFSHLDLKDFPDPDLSHNVKELQVDDQPIQSEERRYKCKQCDKAYKHAGSLANHRQSHTVGVYQCAVCFKEFSNLMALKNHSRIHTEYKPYNCTLCDQCFRLPTELTSHQKLHTGESPFACTYCGQGFLTKRECQRHKRLHANLQVEAKSGHTRTSEGSENSTSEEEAIETPAKIDSYKHLFQKDHKESPPEAPLSNHNGGVKDISVLEGSPFTVPQIDQQNNTAPITDPSSDSGLSPQNEKTMSCANCAEAFTDNESLASHVCMQMEESSTLQQNNHPNPNCNFQEEPQCSENPEERPYKCEECGKTYRHAGSLINHKKTHQTGVYDCSICSKQLFNMAALKNHLRAHLKNKANRGLDISFFNSTNFLPDSFQCTDGYYVCTICGDSYTSESDLQLHHTLHEAMNIPDTSSTFPFLTRKPQDSPVEDLQSPLDENDQTINQQRAVGLLVAEEIKEIKRERGLNRMAWASQVDEAKVAENPDPEIEGGSLPNTELFLKKEESCPGRTSPEQALIGFQSQFFSEQYNHTIGEGNLSEYEGQSDQDPSTANERRYKCNLCDRTYRHRGSLVNHKHTHQTGIYQCSICPKQYSNVMALRNHVRVHFRTPMGIFKSGLDEASSGLFATRMEKFFSCTVCGEDFQEQVEWHAHQLMHGSQKELQDYQNAIDLQEFNENTTCKRSPMAVTNEDCPYNEPNHFEQGPCDQEADCFENKFEDEDGGSEEGKMSHICSHCGHIFEDIESFQAHILVHECEKMHDVKKTENEQTTATKSEIDSVADGCAQDTSDQLDSVAGGCKPHTESRLYGCDLCGKSYRHSGSLINHKRIHQMGDYACSLCSKQFNNLATLKNHLRSHQRSKRERGLDNSDHLSLFMPELHYSEATFKDTVCERNLSNEVELGSQMDHHSGVETTGHEIVLTSQVSQQSKMIKDLTEDIQTLHSPNPNQLLEGDSSPVDQNESVNPKAIRFSNDATCKQISSKHELEFKNNSDMVHTANHCGVATDRVFQQSPEIEEDEKCTSPGVSPMETNLGTVCEGQAEASPDVGSSEERPYKCDECDKTYRHAGSLINHKHTHQTGIYQCSFCPKEYPNLMGLRNHFRTHTKPPFNRIRGSTSADFFGLQGEIHQPRSGEELYDCSLCGMVFADEGAFHQHQFAHSKPKALPGLEIDIGLPTGLVGGQSECDADGSFAELHFSDFSFHMHAAEKELLSRLKHEMKDMDQGDPQDDAYYSESHLSHICGFCGKTYDDLESLKIHSLSHSEELAPHAEEVSDCPRVDFDKLNFDASPVSEMEGNVNKSEMFAKTKFPIDSNINEGPESRPFACNQCEKTYRHGGSLVNHKKTHLIGDYQCSGCSRQYPNLAAYRNHLRHHPKCKEQATANDELKASHASTDGKYPEGSGEASGHTSVIENSWKESDVRHSPILHSNAMSQGDHVHPTKMVTDISNSKDGVIEVTKSFQYAEHGVQGLPRDAAVDHKLTSDAASGNVDESQQIGTPNTVNAKHKICDLCGQTSDPGVGFENHKACFCNGQLKECQDVANSDLSAGNTESNPTSGNLNTTDHLNGCQELEQGNFQRPFSCEICGRSYRHAGSLINHKQTHKTGLFRCSVCQKRFFNMMALKNHNRIHFEIKRFKCTECGKAFRLQKQLLAHQKMHRDKAALAKRPSRQGKRVVKIPLRLLDELTLMDQGGCADSKTSGDAAEKKVSLKRRRPKKTLDPDERPFRCEQCGRSYRHAGSLLNHKRSHTTGHYCCSICDKTYPNLMAMKNHQRVHFEVKRHVCPECGKAFKWQRQLSRHQLLHTLKKYKCDFCGQTFQGKVLFEKHQLEHGHSQGDGLQSFGGERSKEHTGDVEKPLNIQTTSKRTGVARRHIRTFKSEIGSNCKNLILQDCEPICRSCSCIFSTFDELEAHHCEKRTNPTSMTETLTSQSTELDPEGTVGQTHEDDVLDKKDTHEPTKLAQTEERPYRCSVCGRTYRHAGSLLNHKNTHTSGLYKCFVCLKQFFNPMAMKNHLRIHTATKRFQCQVCGKAFRASRELITHSRVHTGERPFTCSVCQRGFSSKLSLRQHQHVHNSSRTRAQDRKNNMTHHTEVCPNGLLDEGTNPQSSSTNNVAGDITMEERPYKCNQCDRAYRHAGSLLNHKKTHTTGLYHCPTCHKQFFNLLAMKNHLRIHLDQNRYKCLDCGKAFRVSSRLASHRRIHMQGGPFPCHLCPKRFFRKSTFQKHQLLHKNHEGTFPQDGMAPKVLLDVT
ncbi:zinc finger protein 646 [Ambystoma mexicanum]|uniref:zinc finger protein 646 n=1 Tax=Ambystoma mexicanum TaxID=8296 RepID=UPI0037E72389